MSEDAMTRWADYCCAAEVAKYMRRLNARFPEPEDGVYRFRQESGDGAEVTPSQPQPQPQG